MLKTKPLSDTLGVKIQGVDLTQELDEPTARAIIAALHEHQVILFRQQDLPPEQFERFALNMGTPIPHVLDHLQLPGLPGVMELSNKAKSERSLNGAGFWHTDQSYEAEPSSCTMLHALQVPKVGGGTCIADMFSAYDDLPKSTKKRIEGLAANHLYGNRDAGKEGEPEASPLKNAGQVARVPMVRHPLVRPHPVTGRKALYGVTGSSREVVGLPPDEGLALLDELKAHATQEKYVYTHFYQVDDVLVWDTASTLHKAMRQTRGTNAHNTRRMHRISIRGIPPLLRSVA